MFFFFNFGYLNKSKIDCNEMSCNVVHVFRNDMSNLLSKSLQEGEHNLQEMKNKSPAWSSKGYHMYEFDIFYFSILFYPITLECHRGTTDEFATIPFHLVLFSAALVELAKSISVHSLYCLPTSSSVCLFFFLFPFTVFHSIVFAITCIQMEKGINVQHNTKIHHCFFL